jgi:hypothetical protein
MKVSTFVVVALAPALALAAPKPLPGDQHEPALVPDPGATRIALLSKNTDGYGVSAYFRVYGATSAKDKLRFDWKAKGKVTSGTCDPYVDGKYIRAACVINDPIKATGPVDVDLVYSDDQTDKDYVVATYHLTVKSWKGIGKSMNWGITPDDLLAVAYARHWWYDKSIGYPYIEFWSSNFHIGGDATLRCTVDGKKIDDLDASFDHPEVATQDEVENDVVTPKGQRYYNYKHYAVEPKHTQIGVRPADGSKDTVYLGDHPGKWDCMLRGDKSKHMREFMFTVDDKGMIQQGSLQDGKHPVALPSNVVLIDMRIPKDNGIEERIRTDALKKTIGFGQAWPDGSGVKATQAAFPPSMGTPD